jgi:hypothetical protein
MYSEYINNKKKQKFYLTIKKAANEMRQIVSVIFKDTCEIYPSDIN